MAENSPRFDEILRYLQPRDDYVIWAGLAAYVHVGTPHSNDVDVYTESQKSFEEMSKEFEARAWSPNRTKLPSNGMRNDLRKESVTFDIVYSPFSRILFEDAARLNAYGYRLKFVSKEALLLTKLGQMSSKGRPPKKMAKDAETIQKLRAVVSAERVSKLSYNMPRSYWASGFV